MQCKRWVTVAFGGLIWIGGIQAAPPAGLQLAVELAELKDHSQAALEYRRLALASVDETDGSAFYWMAGYEYSRASRPSQAERMVGLSEQASVNWETEIYLLRGDISRALGRPGEAVFYMEGLTLPPHPDGVRRLAARRLAAARLRLGDYDLARQAVMLEDGPPRAAALQAIDAYERGRDKSPVTGGLLGLIPGLGYAYSGEYANALRSLLMNGLCIWGLVEFADRDMWGGVAVVGFAELTFYSGSIYGGADAAVRHNRRRLEAAVRGVEEGARFEVNTRALPLLELTFEF